MASLIYLVTDGTENGLTAANKINAGFAKTDTNETNIATNVTNIDTNVTNIATNRTDIDSTYKSTNIVIETGTDIDTLILEGKYYVDTNLPDAYVDGDLEIIKYFGLTQIDQGLVTKSDGTIYTRTSVLGDGSDWTVWTETLNSIKMNDVEVLRASGDVTSSLGIDIDTIILRGFYLVNTNLPNAYLAGDLEVIEYNGDIMITQFIIDSATGEKYTRDCVLGDGVLWTAWVEEIESLRISNVENPDSIVFTPLVTPPSHIEGQVYYNANTETYNFQGPFPGIEVKAGHENHMHVINNTGVTIEKGMAVRHNGVAGGIVQIAKCLADTFDNARILGITVQDIPTGTQSAITTFGEIEGVDTSAVNTGVPLFLSDTIPGTFTETPPDIVSRIGGALTQDATTGRLFVAIVNNKNLPNIFGGMSGQTVGNETYSLTAVSQDINNFELTEEIVVTVDELIGEITLPNDGQYRINFIASMAFLSSIATRTVTFELYDVTNAEIHYPYVKNIPRDATEDSLSFSFPIKENAGSVHKMRVKSNTPFDVTFGAIEFDIESINLR